MSDDSEHQLNIDDAEYRRTLEQALDRLGMGVVMSKHGRVRYASQSHLDLIGYTLEELTATTFLDFVDEPQRLEIVERLERRRAEAHAHEVSRFDVRLRHKSGRLVDANVVNAPLAGTDGDILTLVRDVTEERAHVRRTEQAHRMEALGHLCAGIAHDFNNYLTAVRMLGEALMDADSREERESLFAELERVTQGAARLTNQLQTFSAAEPQRRVVLDINIVVFEMAEMLRRITGRQVELALNLEPGLPATQVNAAQLQQVVVNLVLNASQAMPDGGRVTLRTSAVDGMVTLEVSDAGNGMSDEVLERAFEPLFTTEPQTRSGMGLSIVYGIARQCDGEVVVDSVPGEGTTVRVLLPQADRPPGRRRSRDPETHTGTPELEVLVVESTDEPIGGLVASGLARAGFAVQQCTLEAAESMELDFGALVLGTPPPAEANELLTRYLSDHAGQVVFISTPPDLSEELWESGRLTHVPKPFSVSELIATIRGDGGG